MNIAEKIRTFLEKLQNLPENKKKIILWVIVVILGLPMAFFWVRGAANSLTEIGEGLEEKSTLIFGDSNNQQSSSPNLSQSTISGDKKMATDAIVDQNNDWKTYENKDYGFEIKYPSSWQRQSMDLKTVWETIIFCPEVDAECKLVTNTIYLAIYKDISTKDNPDIGNPLVHYLGLNKFYYYIALSNESAENRSIFDQMISTFKFTK